MNGREIISEKVPERLSEYPCQCRTLSTPHARHASCLVTLPLPLPTNHLSSHRLYLPIAVMSSQLDVTLAHACDALRTGRYPSFRATAKVYSLTESTLRRQYQNLTSTRTDAATSKRSITPWQEELLVTWIINMEQSGHPVSYSQLREFVSLLNVSSGGEDCGHNWTQRFLKRRPEL